MPSGRHHLQRDARRWLAPIVALLLAGLLMSGLAPAGVVARALPADAATETMPGDLVTLRASGEEVATFVAIRYGLALASPDEALGKCATHLTRWKQLLTAHREHVEMTLKVAAATIMLRPDRRDFTSGAGYLRALHAAQQASNVDPAFRANAERLIAPLAVKYRWEHRDERSVELAALVERTRLDEVMAAGEQLRAASAEVPFLLSGPWPLEVFADADR